MEDCTINEGLLAKEMEAGQEKEKEGNELEESLQDMGGDDIEPKEGMMFKSLEDVYAFYMNYAQRTGFSTKTRSTWRENGEVRKCVLACVREGKCDSTKKCRYSTKMTARIGCKAQINTRLYEDGFWHLTKVNLEHNHSFSSSKARFFRSNKKLKERVKKQLELNGTVGIPVCESFLMFDEKEGRSYVESARRLRLGEGAVEAIHQYFMRMQNQNSNFFYLVDMDGDGRLRNAFWADARSRSSYQYFGDVISFDTTYLTNKYDIPFVAFVGINHHGQFVLLGCGLISIESIESYVWLFTAWLTCMSGRPPNAIITDQYKSVQGAVSQVFPSARHALSLWHIMKKVPEKLCGFKEQEAIIWKLKQTVYDSLRVEEFEQNWGEMIENYALKDNKWLQSLYEIRQKWVPVFVKDTFWAGMFTSQRNERMNPFFDSYVNSKTSLKQFISQYEVALEKKYEDEFLAEFNAFHKEPDLFSYLPFENQLRTLYTRNIFTKFQEEVKKLLNCRVTLLFENGPFSIYEVRERMSIEGSSEPVLKKFEVCFNAEKVEVQCICRSFEFRGILCNHAICVLDYKDVSRLPPQYIVQRWRKDFKRLHDLKCSDGEVTGFANSPMDRFDDIYRHCHGIAELGSISDVKYKLALIAIKKLKEELLACDDENQNNHLIGGVGHEEILTNQVIDPVHVKRNAKKKKTQRSPTNKSSSAQETHNHQMVLEGEVNNINQRDVPLMQRSIQIGQQPIPFTGTEKNKNATECSEAIDSEVRVQPCFGYAPYSFEPMAQQGNHTF